MASRRRWRSRAISFEFPDIDAEPTGLIAKVVGDAGTGKDDDARWHDRKHVVVAAKRGGLGVLVPVGLEGDLGDLAGLGPAGGDTLGAFGRAPCSRIMSACLAWALSSAAQIRS